MQEEPNSILIKNILLFILIGIILFSIFKYVDYSIELNSQRIALGDSRIKEENILLQNKIIKLEKNINELKNYFNLEFENERKNNNNLTDKFNKINNEVSFLTKLNELDQELLKKYSKVYFLNEHYTPPSLVDIPEEYLSKDVKNTKILQEVLPFLAEMMDNINKENLNMQVQSAYRSFETQKELKNNYTLIYGTTSANKFSADQGYSEHQLGTTIDFTTKENSPKLNGFEKTKEYEWMKENAYKYGFILSYPAGNTYYRFEPWHWRFVGVSLATYLYENNLNFYDVDEREILNYLPFIFD